MSNPIRMLGLLTALALACPAYSDDFVVDKSESILGFINHKKGFAKGLIDDPMTYPSAYTINVSLNSGIETCAFDFVYEVKDIQVADETVLNKWGQRVLDGGGTVEPLKASSKSRRKKIRKTILSKKLMDEANYPVVSAKSLGVAALSAPGDFRGRTHELTIEVVMHGETVTATFPATIKLEDDRLIVDAVFALRMTDFSIKPYSAFFGAVKFDDVYHVYMHLEAARAPEEE